MTSTGTLFQHETQTVVLSSGLIGVFCFSNYYVSIDLLNLPVKSCLFFVSATLCKPMGPQLHSWPYVGGVSLGPSLFSVIGTCISLCDDQWACAITLLHVYLTVPACTPKKGKVSSVYPCVGSGSVCIQYWLYLRYTQHMHCPKPH